MATIQQTQNFPPNYDGTMVAVPPPPVPPPGRNPYARRTGGIPLPPAQPANDPNMLQTDVPADPLSPTTLVLNYLKSRGYQPTAENIRRTVEANARDPSVLGADPVAGLRNARASTDAEDLAAMRAAGVGGAGGAGRSGGGQGGSGLVREEGSWDVEGKGGQPNTSAAPSSWRGPFSGPPDPTNTLTTTADQAMRYGLPNGPSMDLPPPVSGATASSSDYVRAPGTPPVNPWDVALNRATGVPPEVPPPPDIPRINAPPPQLALPPPAAPPMAQPDVPIPQPPPAPPPAPMPDVPNVVGQAARPPIRTSTTLRGQPTPEIAPGNRIQGAPIQPGPIAGPLGRAVVGGIAGATRGIPGAIAGAAPGAADLAKYILSGRLHLQ